MTTTASSYSMAGMSHGGASASLKTIKPMDVTSEPMEVDPESPEAGTEMFIKPFEEISNPQGYTFFEPF